MNTSSLSVYTDGGCIDNPGVGGWAYIILDNTRRRLHVDSGRVAATTNNRMEICAVIASLQWISASDLRSQPVNVYTDSQYVKNGITTWINTWLVNNWRTSNKKEVKNRDLWTTLHNLQQLLHLEWHWVRGHDGNYYNEYCHSLVAKILA